MIRKLQKNSVNLQLIAEYILFAMGEPSANQFIALKLLKQHIAELKT